jgi:rsbT co-antagonist protein RsbR
LSNEENKENSNLSQNKQKKAPLQISLFKMLQANLGDSLAIARLNKAALVEISHALENTVLSNRLPSMVFTGFQESSNWRREIARYRELAEIAHSVCIFSGGPLSFPDQTDAQKGAYPEIEMAKVTLAKGDALRQEWFLLVLTKEFNILLCGLDQLESVDREADRVFETILSFDPVIITHTLDLLEKILEHYLPEKLTQIQEGRKLFPPVIPNMKYLSILTTQFVGQAGMYDKVRRRIDQEQAMRATINRLLHEASQPVTTQLTLLELCQQLGEVLPEDLETIFRSSQELKQLLEELSKVSSFNLKKFEQIEYLDTGKPIFNPQKGTDIT